MITREIGSNVAALIFTTDGVEFICPDLMNEDFDELPCPKHIQMAAITGLMLVNPEPRFVELRTRLEQLLDEVCEEPADG